MCVPHNNHRLNAAVLLVQDATTGTTIRILTTQEEEEESSSCNVASVCLNYEFDAPVATTILMLVGGVCWTSAYLVYIRAYLLYQISLGNLSFPWSGSTTWERPN
jgi:hypothetical protein